MSCRSSRGNLHSLEMERGSVSVVHGCSKDGDGMLTVAEVAARLRVSRGLIYSLVEENLIGHIRIGTGRGTIRFTEDDVQEYLASCRLKSEKTGPRLRHLA